MRQTLLQGLRPPLTENPPADDDPELLALAATVKAAAERTLGRSLAIRHVDAGSCNACELEIHALSNAFYDLERFGFRFVASPRHADVLLVTGPVTLNMREALERTYAATPAPKWVVASGACAADGGVFAGSYAIAGGASSVVPVDLVIPGCPPSPAALLKGLLALMMGGDKSKLINTRRCGFLDRTGELVGRTRTAHCDTEPPCLIGARRTHSTRTIRDRDELRQGARASPCRSSPSSGPSSCGCPVGRLRTGSFRARPGRQACQPRSSRPRDPCRAATQGPSSRP